MTDKRNSENPRRGKDFQRLAQALLSQCWGVSLECEVELPIGNPSKYHRFDLASRDRKYVGESKNYTWTSGGNVPSAKMAFLNEAVFYLSHLPPRSARFIVLPKHVHPKTGERLADYYYRTYKHLLNGVRIVEIDTTTSTVRELGDS